LGGWNARTWRREVGGWLLLAFLYVAAWASCSLILHILGVLSEALR